MNMPTCRVKPFARALVAIGILVGAMQPATAAVITRTYIFSVSDWTSVGNANPSPFANVTGSFVATFDPAGPAVTGVALTISNFTLPATSILMNVNVSQAGRLQIGGAANDVGSLLVGANDFFMQVSAAHLAMPQLDTFIFTSSDDPSGLWFANTRTLSFVEGSAGSNPVPGPGAYALLGVGLACLALRRRR